MKRIERYLVTVLVAVVGLSGIDIIDHCLVMNVNLQNGSDIELHNAILAFYFMLSGMMIAYYYK